MKHKLTYHFQFRAWVPVLVLTAISFILSSLTFFIIMFIHPSDIISLLFSLVLGSLPQILFLSMLFTRKKPNVTRILFLAFLAASAVYYLMLQASGYHPLYPIVTAVFFGVTFVFALRGQRTEILFICSAVFLMIAHSIEIIRLIKYEANYYYFYSNLQSQLEWALSDLSMFAGLIIFSFYNILPPSIALSADKALKHLNIAKKKGNISEEEYNLQRTNILTCL